VGVSPWVRTVRTASGATAVQVVWSKRGGVLDLEHVGSAHDDVELTMLRHAAAARIHAGQEPFDLSGQGQVPPVGAGSFPIVASRAARVWQSLRTAWEAVGFGAAIHDEVFWQMVAARVVEPVSKADSLRVLGELGTCKVPSYRTVENCLDRCVKRDYRSDLEVACAAHVGAENLRLCLYDVTTLYWETDTADEFRIPGYSKERRLEPQIIVGLLTDAHGFPLLVRAFEGNKAETKTIVPVLEEFRRANPDAKITVVADAGMMSEKNLNDLEDAGYQFIVGGRIPEEPGIVRLWRIEHPGVELTDQQIFSSTRTGTKKRPRAWRVWYQYRTERAKKNLHGIEASVAKAEQIVAGTVSAKKNRFLKDTGGRLQIDAELVASARLRAGIRSYVTNLDADPQFIINTYHQLYQVEAAFRMSKHDLRARPAFHYKRERIEAHLTIVFAALAIGRWLESVTGISLRAFLHAVRPIRQVTLDINGTPVTGEDTITDAARQALAAIDQATPAHVTKHA